MDLVSACLIFHEVPAQGTREILTEAYRVLRPAGTLAIMVIHFNTWHHPDWQITACMDWTSKAMLFM